MNEKFNFKLEVQRELEAFASAADNFPWHTKEAYAGWLGQANYFVKHATYLLSLAAAQFGVSRKPLHDRFLDHLREERGHDVMLTRDLKALNYTPTDFPELAETSALYQSQYYWIDHVNPVAFFGYILCLEGIAVYRGKEIYKTVCDNFGEKAGLFLKVHANEDIEHLDKALSEIEKCTTEEQMLVIENMKLSRKLYCNIFESIKRNTKAQILTNDRQVQNTFDKVV